MRMEEYSLVSTVSTALTMFVWILQKITSSLKKHRKETKLGKAESSMGGSAAGSSWKNHALHIGKE